MTTPRKRLAALAAVIGVGAFFYWQRGTVNDPPSSAQKGADSASRVAVPIRERARIAPQTLEPAALRGTVRNKEGGPIRGARVCASPWSEELSSEDVRVPYCTSTAADGSYELAGLVPARYRPSASADSFQPATYEGKDDEPDWVELEPGETRGDIDLELRPGGVEVHGRVLDIGGGPVAGAVVTATSGSFWRGGGSHATAFSDAEGAFSLWTREGQISVSAAAEGYAGGSASAIAPGETVEVLLTPESVIAGKVVDATSGQAIARAEVTVGSFGYSWRDSVSTSSGSAFTDENGMFRITRLSPGRYKPKAEVAGYYGEARQSVLLGLGQTEEGVVVEVHPAAVVSGTVLIGEDDEQPCTDGSVGLRDKKSDRWGSWQSIDDSGLVEFEAVLPGSYDVNVYCDGYLSEDEYDEVEVADKDVTGLVWRVGSGAAVAGTVRDSSGLPIPEAEVSIEGMASDDPRARRDWERTVADDDGTYEAEGLVAGKAKVKASADGYPEPADPVEVALKTGSTARVDLTLEEGATVTGKVVDESQQPVAGADIYAESVERQEWRWRGGTRSRDDGTFTLEGLRGGRYRVTASLGAGGTLRAPGKSDDDVSGVTVDTVPGQSRDVTLLVESMSGRIRGRVVDESGTPITDAYVAADRESESAGAVQGNSRRSVRWTWRRRPSMTDTDGAFVLDELADGKYTVRAYRKGGGEALAEGVAVGSDVTLTVERTGEIRGSVAVESGQPPTAFTITVDDKEMGFSRNERFFRTGGEWAMTELPPGTYDVSVSAKDGTTSQSVVLGSGQKRDGVQLTLAPRATLRGRIVDSKSGEPVGGLFVAAMPVSGGDRMSFSFDSARENITDSEGKFTVESAPTGRIFVQAFPMDWEDGDYQWARKLVNVEAGEEVDVGDIAIVKKRVKKDQAAGDLGFVLKQQPPDTEPEDIEYVVALVRPAGPATESGLQVGDKIIGIDGHDLRGDPYSYYTLASIPPGATIELELERGEKVEIKAGPPREADG